MPIITPMICLLGGGNTDEVLRECEEILDADKDQAVRAFFLRGLAYAVRDENAEAVENFTSFIEEINTKAGDTNNALGFAHRFRAQAYEAMGEIEHARHDLYAAIECYDENNPDHSDVIADLRQRIQDVHLKKIASDHTAVQPMIAKAFDELANGNLEAVIEISETLCEAQEQDKPVKAFFLRGLARDLIGRRHAKAGEADEAAWMKAKDDFQKAIADYSRVIEDADKEFHFLTTTYARRAQLFISLKQAESAQNDLNIVLESEPDNSRARLHRGIAMMQQHYFSDAIIDFDEVLKGEPNNVRALDLHGQAALIVLKYDSALASFQKARNHAQDRPTNIRLRLLEALTLFLKKNYRDALVLMEKIAPELRHLPHNELRELQPKFEILQEKLSVLPKPSSPEEQEEQEEQEEEKQIERQRLTFESQDPEEEERVKAGLTYLFWLAIRQKLIRSGNQRNTAEPN